MALFARLGGPQDAALSWAEVRAVALTLNPCVATALIYDVVITMDKEVRFFWDKKLSLSKLVFFLNRYVGIVGAVMALTEGVQHPSLSLCAYMRYAIWAYLVTAVSGYASLWAQDISYALTIISIDYILTIRVLALYQNERKITVVLYTLLALEAAGKAVMMVYATSREPAMIVRLSPHLDTCDYADLNPQFIAIVDWTLPLALGTLLFGLALYEGCRFWKLNGYDGSRLVAVLIRDQALYFLLIILSSLFALLGNVFSSSLVLGGVLDRLGRPSLLSILGSHIFFNLKEAAEYGINAGTNWSSYSHSAIRFEDERALSLQEVGKDGKMTMDFE